MASAARSAGRTDSNVYSRSNESAGRADSAPLLCDLPALHYDVVLQAAGAAPNFRSNSGSRCNDFGASGRYPLLTLLMALFVLWFSLLLSIIVRKF